MKSLVYISGAVLSAVVALASGDASAACDSIAKIISNDSQVFHAVSHEYEKDIKHYMSSSTQRPACVVEVGSTADTAEVMKIVGSTRTPFAVKSGGHASNPGFSSTKGVQISLTRLSGLRRSSDNKSATIGLGNTWIDVYTKLDGTGYNVVGGRVTGPGTGGFTLGGGFSWLTNAHGLTCDTTEQYTLVLPNGTVTEVDSKQPDLFFALKGGLNRFGVVTEIRYKLVPQIPKVYGGVQFFSREAITDLIKATAQFSQHNQDPKAQVILTINNLVGTADGALLSFYNGPERPAAFAPFDSVKAEHTNLASQSFLDFVQTSPSEATRGSRGAFHTLSTTRLTEKMMNAVFNESTHYGTLAALHEGVFLSYDVEPFLHTYGTKATDSAFPHAASPLPLNLYFVWELAEEDDYWRAHMQTSVNYLISIAKAEGIFSEEMYKYPNYALSSTPAHELYGRENTARLRAIKQKVDPDGIMELAGGFNL